MDLTTVAVYTVSDDLLIPIGHKEHPCRLLTFHHLERNRNGVPKLPIGASDTQA
ncbi:MAG: hypothetical protein OXI67_02790 [Candidatus Poribacteria bacterium]|nr:hypothetical protein [Candidatus Poribacteria bacterium]